MSLNFQDNRLEIACSRQYSRLLGKAFATDVERIICESLTR